MSEIKENKWVVWFVKTVCRLNVGILNKGFVNQAKMEIQKYIKENDNGEVDPTRDVMKAVIRGKLIAQTSLIKRQKFETYRKHTKQLRELERE